jgi:hypothetical protein
VEAAVSFESMDDVSVDRVDGEKRQFQVADAHVCFNLKAESGQQMEEWAHHFPVRDGTRKAWPFSCSLPSAVLGQPLHERVLLDTLRRQRLALKYGEDEMLGDVDGQSGRILHATGHGCCFANRGSSQMVGWDVREWNFD